MGKRWYYLGLSLIVIYALSPWDSGEVFYYKGGVPITLIGRWFGVAFFALVGIYAIRGRPKSNNDHRGLYEDHICPKCERVFLKGENPDKHMCPDCKVELEPLEGFYDRHPELKDDEENPEKSENIK
ncbi:hypothetical protein [Maridesulfovibrio frigidus]|uniref:hypothetical protein n=1 Tax=Maridesulfovibrio frigidus TaxID=340956 RepID=UPI0004E1CD97|nr:hypothetical protein [Maridesulfovibrio frigidus]